MVVVRAPFVHFPSGEEPTRPSHPSKVLVMALTYFVFFGTFHYPWVVGINTDKTT